MYSLRYGTPPIVRATGGLADTVIDASDTRRGNGFVFDQATPAALLATLRRGARALQPTALGNAPAPWHERRLWLELARATVCRSLSNTHAKNLTS